MLVTRFIKKVLLRLPFDPKQPCNKPLKKRENQDSPHFLSALSVTAFGFSAAFVVGKIAVVLGGLGIVVYVFGFDTALTQTTSLPSTTQPEN